MSKLAWLCCPVLLCAQTPQAGLQPDWDIRAILQEMSAHALRLQPVLNQVDVNAWVSKGASETYIAQLQSSKDQARAMADDAKALGRNPEKISACLQLYFRVQGLEQMISSLVEAIRKYQDPALAETLTSLSAENGANRNRLETYIVNLATQQEQECAVMDREAQRCRGILSKQPSSTANRGKKN
ncbi:MAG TPA: hypothetical protein VG096_21400 [Bryobacteraceae bacterium]|nr:hypothetical protein [Bryobacteraceae bacterium]